MLLRLGWKLIAIVALLGASCEDDPVQTAECGTRVVLSAQLYQSADLSGFTITSASIEENCMSVTISSSGCDGSTWELTAVDAQVVLESLPVQRNLCLILDNSELCDAVIQRDFEFDLTPVQTEDYEVVLLNLAGWDDQLRYEY